MEQIALILTVAVLVLAVGFFVFGKFRVDLIAMCALAVLLVLGLISPEEGLYGFANQATLTIGAMFVVSMGLVRTGLVQWIAQRIDRLAGKGELRLILVLCVITAALSAFMVNTATVAILIPVVITLTAKRKISSSRVLIPLSFASQFGGVCTIIGTSTNMLVNGIGISKGMDSFRFFEFLPLGLVLVVVGTGYLLITSRWLLPKRKGEVDQVDKYLLADYQAELQVLGNSTLIGGTWEESKITPETKIELSNLMREGKAVARPKRTKIRPGDLLIVNGNIDEIIEIENKYDLEMFKNIRSVYEEQSHEVRLVEALIPPNSNLIGQTIQGSNFFRSYGHPVLAIQRRGKSFKERLADIKLESGDTLLVHGQKDDIARLKNSPNIIVTNELTELSVRREKTTAALLVIIAVVVLAVTNVVPIMVAAMIGAAGMVLTRCITVEEAYNAIDWKIIFLLGGIIPLGLAIEQNGIVPLLADSVLRPLIAYGPVAVLAVIYIVVAVLTEAMSNNAAAAIMAPIAFSLAALMGVNPRPFLVAIAFAASTSFATPIGYQTNTMVYSAGGYRFTDFTRIGVPLNLIFWGLATLLIPLIWNF